MEAIGRLSLSHMFMAWDPKSHLQCIAGQNSKSHRYIPCPSFSLSLSYLYFFICLVIYILPCNTSRWLYILTWELFIYVTFTSFILVAKKKNCNKCVKTSLLFCINVTLLQWRIVIFVNGDVFAGFILFFKKFEILKDDVWIIARIQMLCQFWIANIFTEYTSWLTVNLKNKFKLF